MRDNSLRSHHSSPLASGVKRPRIAKPSVSSATSGAANSLPVRPRHRASSSGTLGRVLPAGRARSRQGRVRATSRLVIGRRDSKLRRRFQLRPQCAEMGELFGRDPQRRSADIEMCGAFLSGKLNEPASTAGPSHSATWTSHPTRQCLIDWGVLV